MRRALLTDFSGCLPDQIAQLLVVGVLCFIERPYFLVLTGVPGVVPVLSSALHIFKDLSSVDEGIEPIPLTWHDSMQTPQATSPQFGDRNDQHEAVGGEDRTIQD